MATGTRVSLQNLATERAPAMQDSYQAVHTLRHATCCSASTPHFPHSCIARQGAATIARSGTRRSICIGETVTRYANSTRLRTTQQGRCSPRFCNRVSVARTGRCPVKPFLWKENQVDARNYLKKLQPGKRSSQERKQYNTEIPNQRHDTDISSACMRMNGKYFTRTKTPLNWAPGASCQL